MESVWCQRALRTGRRAGQEGAHLVAVVHGGDDLPKEMAGVLLAEPLPLADVVIQVAPAGVLHDDHNLAAVLKHWSRARQERQALPEYTVPHWGVTHASLAPNPMGPFCRDVCQWDGPVASKSRKRGL